ncbi:hypothetical protein [Oceanobacillus luteolus]|uniref:hypothetical protein n=1 Tax=Oceanobacillus luteolus TaxID=1274358 RepID=UPI0020410445|nr:hypothetical protein [Oceanobacillus luteolus]
MIVIIHTKLRGHDLIVTSREAKDKLIDLLKKKFTRVNFRKMKADHYKTKKPGIHHEFQALIFIRLHNS